jgi:hypothetical protein
VPVECDSGQYVPDVFQTLQRLYAGLAESGGGVLVAMGVLLFTGYLTVLNTYVISLTPQWLWSWL